MPTTTVGTTMPTTVETSSPSIRVMIVDDHTLVANALREVLDDRPDFTTVAVAIDPHEAIELARCTEPDVVLIDYRLGDLDGIEVGSAIRAAQPNAALILMSGAVAPRMVADAVDAGFAGFLDKTCSIDRLVNAVRSVASGHLALDAGAFTQLLQRPAGPGLTAREREVLALMAEGLSTKAIAARAFISVNTARKHVQSILAALDAHSKLEAVVVARRRGLVD